MNGSLEREVKLQSPQAFSLARLEPQLDAYRATPVELRRLHTVYYDTEDYRLARWGASLRYRGGEGWMLKLPVGGTDKALHREELKFPGDARTVPPQALELATAYLRGKPVGPVAELRTIRASRHVTSGGEDLAEIVQDDVRVVQGSQVVKRFRQIEIELEEHAGEDVLADLTRALQLRGAGDPDPLPKNVAALGDAAAPQVRAPEIGPDARIVDVVRAAFAHSVERLVHYDAALRLRHDAEAVHQARVAIRRLRADLKTFSPVLERAWADDLRERLSWIANVLGEARDADVLLETLVRLGDALPAIDRAHLDETLASFTADREKAYASLDAMLHEARYVRLLDEAVNAAAAPHFNERAAEAARDVIPELMRRAWRRLRKTVRARGNPPADRDLHKIRIRAKSVRYAAEAVCAVAGSRAAAYAARAEALQTLLGDQHDAVVACERLRQRASEPGGFVRGELAMLEQERAQTGREQWQRCWRRLKKRKARFW